MNRVTDNSAAAMCRRVLALLCGLTLLTGCRSAQPEVKSAAARSTAPATPVSTTGESRGGAAALRARHFSVLLNFERDTDALFVQNWPSAASADSGAARTGHSSLLLPAGTKRASIKLATLLSGRRFPASWTLVGGYLYSESATRATLAYVVQDQPLLEQEFSVPAGQWTAVMIDLTRLPAARPGSESAVASAAEGLPEAQSPPVGMLSFSFDRPAAGPLWLDDVMLIDNAETLVDDTPAGGWRIVQRGLRVIIDRPDGFSAELPTTDASPAGWKTEEATPLRARFSSPAGKVRALTIYRDGRAIWDGRPGMLGKAGRAGEAFADAHASPAEVSVAPGGGRLNRNTEGDADNDGFNEVLGAYQVVASQPRLEITITPRSSPVPSPVLQVSGLPAGKVLATVEGQLIDRSVRLPDGQLLLMVPSRIERPTTVNLRLH